MIEAIQEGVRALRILHYHEKADALEAEALKLEADAAAMARLRAAGWEVGDDGDPYQPEDV